MHLLAYDYWSLLRSGEACPDFRALTPQGLQPFRSASLLLDFSDRVDGQVRYAGDGLAGLLSADPVAPGTDFAILADSPLGGRLLTHLRDPAHRGSVSEFTYRDDRVAGRGVLLPLDKVPGDGAFVLVVTSFDAVGDAAEEMGTPIAASSDRLARSLEQARALAAEAPALNAGGRAALYDALAAALAFYEAGQVDLDGYIGLLKEAGIRRQSRAPFTPALKLVFGKDHDKTRLTEYAAALSHAARDKVKSHELARYLNDIPGGIKGCVAMERDLRRGKAARDPLRDIERVDPIGKVDLTLEGVSLLLARPDGNETAIIGQIPVTEATLKRMVQDFIKKSAS